MGTAHLPLGLKAAPEACLGKAGLPHEDEWESSPPARPRVTTAFQASEPGDTTVLPAPVYSRLPRFISRSPVTYHGRLFKLQPPSPGNSSSPGPRPYHVTLEAVIPRHAPGT